MASEPSNSQFDGGAAALAAGGTAALRPEQLTVNLQVVSPSVGINHPLLFPDLAATTTIKQLKERIRQTLPLRPADEHQRLIHRGRALLREADSLLEIFGADALRTPDRHTVHLVVRETSDSQSSTPSSATRGPSPAMANTNQAPNAARYHANPGQFPAQALPQFARRTPPQATGPTALAPGGLPVNASAFNTPAQMAALQQSATQQQQLTNWLMQREATRVQAANQRNRAQMGMHGIGDTAAGNDAQNPEANNGRASPAATHTVYRETTGPNGHTYQVETTIRTSGPAPQGGLSPADVHNIIRGVDSSQATMAMASAMHRNASGASLHNRSLNQPGVATPVIPAGSRAGSGRATPDPAARATSGGSHAATTPFAPTQRRDLDVYILSSPDGPRALLVNNSTAETYYTPRSTGQTNYPYLRNVGMHNLLHATQQHVTDHHQPPAQGGQAQQAQGQQPVAAQHQQPAHAAHPNNPPVAALPPMLMQVWAHAWLVVRLGLFVWFFTTPNTSWSRWFTVIGLALFMFVLSTGALNGIAENVWRPLGRHLENVLPGHDRPRPRREAAAGGDAGVGGTARDGEPDPTQMAARLVAERQAQASWFTSHMRRIERAGLLFLASIAPGVAERHIARLEAEIREDERRAREAEAAAAAAAEAATNTEEGGEGSGGAENESNSNANDASAEQQPEGQQEQGATQGDAPAEQPRQDLIAL